MEYIAVIINDGTLSRQLALPDGEVWHVVPTASDLPTVRLALAHGATPIVGESTPFAAVECATRLDLARPWAREQPYLDLGDRIYLLTRGWCLLDDGAVAITAWLGCRIGRRARPCTWSVTALGKVCPSLPAGSAKCEV